MVTLKNLKKETKKVANSKTAKLLQRFFKTGKGQYGEGDIFLGLKVPVQRKIAKKYTHLSLQDIAQLLKSKIHEHRLMALFILIDQYKKASLTGLEQRDREKIFKFYLKNLKGINNWDLVDLSAPNIMGYFLLNKKRDILYKMARSNDLWQKRIAIISTYTFIKNNQFTDSLKIAKILLYDKHDLIHKAVGWMLRELGKRDQALEEKFLKRYHQKMPRTMLRYAIEKFNQGKRALYLKK